MERDELFQTIDDARELLLKKHGGMDGYFRHLKWKTQQRLNSDGTDRRAIDRTMDFSEMDSSQ